MWGVNDIVNALKIVPKPEPLPTPPPKKTEPPVDSQTKTAEQNQLGIQRRSEIVRTAAENPAHPTAYLLRGDNNGQVKKLQNALVKLDYADPDNVSQNNGYGAFRPATENALKTFQKDNQDIYERQLAADGIYGPLTRGALQKSLQEKSGAAAGSPPATAWLAANEVEQAFDAPPEPLKINLGFTELTLKNQLSPAARAAQKLREVVAAQTPEAAALTIRYAEQQGSLGRITEYLGQNAKIEDGGYGDNKLNFDAVVDDLAAAVQQASAAPSGKGEIAAQTVANSIVRNIDPDDIGRFDEALGKPIANGTGRTLTDAVIKNLTDAGRTSQALDINLRDGLENPSAERVREAAFKHAPLLILPPGSSSMPNVNLPADPAEYIENSRLRENVSATDLSSKNPFGGHFSPFGKDAEYGNNTNDEAGDNFSPTDVGNTTNEDAFLDLNDEKRGQIGSPDAPVSYQFERGEFDANGKMTKPPTMTYHIFYGFNDAPSPVGNGTFIADHEGDWERVTYELDPQTLEPIYVLPSQHEGGDRAGVNEIDPATNRLRVSRDSATSRPLIYVATGSHANYLQSGDDFSLPLGTKDKTVVDQNGDGRVNESDGAVIFDTARNLNEATAQSWYPQEDSRGVRWGGIGKLENNDLLRGGVKKVFDQDPSAINPSGPQGPSYDKGAVEP